MSRGDCDGDAPLTELECAALFAVCWAQCEGRVIAPLELPVNLGTVMVKLKRLAAGAIAPVAPAEVLAQVMGGLAEHPAKAGAGRPKQAKPAVAEVELVPEPLQPQWLRELAEEFRTGRRSGR